MLVLPILYNRKFVTATKGKVTELEQTISVLKYQNVANEQLRSEFAAATAQFQNRVETLNGSITFKLANLDN